MAQTILFSNVIKKKNTKAIDYILAAPAGLAVMSFIGGFKHRNPIYRFGMTEFSVIAGLMTLEITAESIAIIRKMIIESCGDGGKVEEA